MFALDDLFKDLSKEGPAIVSPLVSVVIPCFNLGDYVEQAVSSVLHQTLKNIEVIVVEGGSTDGQTRQRVEEMAANPDSRLRVFFRHGEHLAGDNRNFGIERASGRYVCCLDADDWIDSSYLEAAVFLAEFFDYDLVSCSLQEFGASNGVWMVEDPSWPQILRRNQVSTAALFRRDLWECLGGYRDWDKGKDHLPEDWDYWIRAVAAGFRGKAIRDTLLHYRVRPDSLSRSSAATKEDLARRMAEVHRDLTTLEAPPPRPLAPFPRAAWACLQAPQARTAMLVVPYFIAVGGAERIFRMLLEEWSRRGFRTLVVATLKPSPKVADGLDSLRNITPHVYSLPNLFPDEPHQQAAFLYFLFRRYGPELVFTAGSDFFYELMPELHEHFPGLAVVDQLFNDKVHLPTNRAFASYIGCTCVPEQGFAAKLIEEYGERPDRVAVVPHGIRIPVTGPSLPPPGWPAEFDGKPVVGFFGRLSPEKAPVDFVQIAAKVAKARPDARFVMTGDGPEKEAVLRALVKSRLGRAFCFAGLVENVHDWMASCSMAVLPSRLDGMPLAVLEAMALGIPVVASRVGSVPEMVKDGVTGVLCKPGDPGAFAAAICRLLGEAHLREAMGRAAKERVQQEFLDTIMLDRYFAVFERLTSKKTAGTGPRAGM
jgi:glycosyltransferase involved in cell wall biosynthesis